MRKCCPRCGLKSLKSRRARRVRQVKTPEGIKSVPYGPTVMVYQCTCGWTGEWNDLAKRRSAKSEKREKQLARRWK